MSSENQTSGTFIKILRKEKTKTKTNTKHECSIDLKFFLYIMNLQ